MKKIFHLGLATAFVLSLASCSKSADDLLPVDESTNAGTTANAGGNTARKTPRTTQGFNLPIVTEFGVTGNSSIYPFINQPHELALGDPKNSVLHVEKEGTAVFYVVIDDPKYLQETIKTAKFTLKDAATGHDLLSYDMISFEEEGSYGITPPAGLSGLSYMFAMVNLEELEPYKNTVFSLYSEISTSSATLIADLKKAFVYGK
jgi:hypothetical protein